MKKLIFLFLLFPFFVNAQANKDRATNLIELRKKYTYMLIPGEFTEFTGKITHPKGAPGIKCATGHGVMIFRTSGIEVPGTGGSVVKYKGGALEADFDCNNMIGDRGKMTWGDVVADYNTSSASNVIVFDGLWESKIFHYTTKLFIGKSLDYGIYFLPKQGTLQRANGNVFTGTFKDGYPYEGKTILSNNGGVIEYKQGKQFYKGKYEEGYYEDIKFRGKYTNGYYEGEALNEQPHGKGTYTDNLEKYVGEWKNGKRYGQGNLYDKSGKLLYSGLWKNNSHFTGTLFELELNAPPTITTTTKPSGLAGLLWFTTSAPLIIGRYGLMDSTTKAVIIKPLYLKTNDFSEGLALVQIAGKGWTYIDKTGKAINSPYDIGEAKDFSEGLAAVAEYNSGLDKKQWGFIDKTGKYVIASQYDEAESFTNGKAKVKKGTHEFFIDKTGNMITDNATGHANSEGWFVAGQSLFGYKDGNGKVVIQPKYIDVRPFKDGLAAVAVKSSYGTPLWFFVDNAGREIARSNSQDIKGNLGYGEVSDFSEGLAAVKGYGGKWGFIDKTGKEVIKLQYENVQSFKDGMAWVEYQGNWGLIDQTEKVLLPFCYNQAISLGEGLYKVKYNYEKLKKEAKKYNALKEVMSKNSVSGVTKGYILDGGIIDKTGKELKLKNYYREFRPFSEGLAAVKYSLWGYIDTTGKQVIDGYYREAGDFKDGKAKVKDERGREFYIDKTGKEIK